LAALAVEKKNIPIVPFACAPAACRGVRSTARRQRRDDLGVIRFLPGRHLDRAPEAAIGSLR
jgi:hypothetical protein